MKLWPIPQMKPFNIRSNFDLVAVYRDDEMTRSKSVPPTSSLKRKKENLTNKKSTSFEKRVDEDDDRFI